VLFFVFVFFSFILRLFFVGPPLEEANIAIFRNFLLIFGLFSVAPPGKFSADALASPPFPFSCVGSGWYNVTVSLMIYLTTWPFDKPAHKRVLQSLDLELLPGQPPCPAVPPTHSLVDDWRPPAQLLVHVVHSLQSLQEPHIFVLQAFQTKSS